jgi:hypothetical protein
VCTTARAGLVLLAGRRTHASRRRRRVLSCARSVSGRRTSIRSRQQGWATPCLQPSSAESSARNSARAESWDRVRRRRVDQPRAGRNRASEARPLAQRAHIPLRSVRRRAELASRARGRSLARGALLPQRTAQRRRELQRHTRAEPGPRVGCPQPRQRQRQTWPTDLTQVTAGRHSSKCTGTVLHRAPFAPVTHLARQSYLKRRLTTRARLLHQELGYFP